MVLKKSENKTLEKTASVILAGGVVIMPCDTIYGIVSFTGDPEKRIREIKGRDEGKPFIRLIGSKKEIKTFTDLKISDEILNLWPGPLTLIVPDLSGGTVAVRVPEDEYLLKLLNMINKPLVSTSVNFTGSPFLNNISDIKTAFENLVDIIVDGGNMDTSAAASTILDITSSPARILRQGSCIVPEYVLK
jgi:L-threonylcarbamoyladenylate synthase